MILFIAEPGDASALWLAAKLRERSLDVKLITPSQLTYARSLAHRLSTKTTRATVVLASGDTIELAGARLIINRIVSLPSEHLRASDQTERMYAQMELHAFVLGLLASLSGRVINSAAPESLSGAHHGPIQARQLAAQSGLPCTPLKIGIGDRPEALSASPVHSSAFIFDGVVVGPVLPEAAHRALLQFAVLWGSRLVQVDFDETGAFADATSFVDFQRGGEALVSLIARSLQ